MVRDTLGLTVRAALSKALRQDGPVKHAGIEFVQEGRLYDLTLEVVPFRMEPFHEQYFLVVFRETELPVSAAHSPGAKEKNGPASTRLRRELARTKLDLAATRESMQSIIEEQEATNEELTSANEEIQSSNEELQSTNE